MFMSVLAKLFLGPEIIAGSHVNVSNELIKENIKISTVHLKYQVKFYFMKHCVSRHWVGHTTSPYHVLIKNCSESLTLGLLFPREWLLISDPS
jgi:hypothetical protein